ncbi:MAG: hypothetical protein PHR96_05400 [Clostridia bacterium]|nr:hypothetical protein [Clostridia bacterium]
MPRRPLRYKYKLYYADGSSQLSGATVAKPDRDIFKWDLDGDIPWDLYDELLDKKISLQETIKLAQPYLPKIITRFEIIDTTDDSVVDSLDII